MGFKTDFDVFHTHHLKKLSCHEDGGKDVLKVEKQRLELNNYFPNCRRVSSEFLQ